LNIEKKWFIKIFIIQRFFVVFSGKKTSKTRRKNARNLNKIQLRSDNDLFKKKIGKL